MRVRLFGEIRIEHHGAVLDPRSFGGRKPKQLLQVLLLRRGHVVGVDEVAALLWPGEAPAGSHSTVLHYASVLRRRLQRTLGAGDLLVTAGRGYTLDTRLFELDLDRFDAAVATAQAVAPVVQRTTFAQALDLVRGDVLADEPDAPWALDVRARYRRAHACTLLQASAAALVGADPVAARDLAERAVLVDPAAEPAACLLVASHYALGDVVAASRAFERCRRALAETLGLDPMPSTVRMHRSVQQGASVTDVVAHATRLARSQSGAAPSQSAPTWSTA